MHIALNDTLSKLRAQRPLIINHTNTVTLDFVANGLSSLGASPLMFKAEQESRDLLQQAHALVINIGTIDEPFMRLAQQIARLANQLKIPLILDPVAVGASHYRLQQCLQLVANVKITVIRGNASEILSLAGNTSTGKGVDSLAHTCAAEPAAVTLAKHIHGIVFVSGAVDLIVSPHKIARCERGSPLMPTVIGTGCLLSAVVAAFTAVEPDPFLAANFAAHFYGVCGEIAAENAQGPGSFKTAFIDALGANT